MYIQVRVYIYANTCLLPFFIQDYMCKCRICYFSYLYVYYCVVVRLKTLGTFRTILVQKQCSDKHSFIFRTTNVPYKQNGVHYGPMFALRSTRQARKVGAWLHTNPREMLARSASVLPQGTTPMVREWAALNRVKPRQWQSRQIGKEAVMTTSAVASL